MGIAGKFYFINVNQIKFKFKKKLREIQISVRSSSFRHQNILPHTKRKKLFPTGMSSLLLFAIISKNNFNLSQAIE